MKEYERLCDMELCYNNLMYHVNTGKESGEGLQYIEKEIETIKKSVLRDDYDKLIRNEKKQVERLKKTRDRYTRQSNKDSITKDINWSLGEVAELERMQKFQERLKLLEIN